MVHVLPSKKLLTTYLYHMPKINLKLVTYHLRLDEITEDINIFKTFTRNCLKNN